MAKKDKQLVELVNNLENEYEIFKSKTSNPNQYRFQEYLRKKYSLLSDETIDKAMDIMKDKNIKTASDIKIEDFTMRKEKQFRNEALKKRLIPGLITVGAFSLIAVAIALNLPIGASVLGTTVLGNVGATVVSSLALGAVGGALFSAVVYGIPWVNTKGLISLITEKTFANKYGDMKTCLNELEQGKTLEYTKLGKLIEKIESSNDKVLETRSSKNPFVKLYGHIINKNNRNRIHHVQKIFGQAIDSEINILNLDIDKSEKEEKSKNINEIINFIDKYVKSDIEKQKLFYTLSGQKKIENVDIYATMKNRADVSSELKLLNSKELSDKAIKKEIKKTKKSINQYKNIEDKKREAQGILNDNSMLKEFKKNVKKFDIKQKDLLNKLSQIKEEQAQVELIDEKTPEVILLPSADKVVKTKHNEGLEFVLSLAEQNDDISVEITEGDGHHEMNKYNIIVPSKDGNNNISIIAYDTGSCKINGNNLKGFKTLNNITDFLKVAKKINNSTLNSAIQKAIASTNETEDEKTL